MLTYNEQLREVFAAYEREHGNLPSGTRQVAEWGITQGLIEPPKPKLPSEVVAEQMARALRESYGVDDKGRRYRIYHSRRTVTKDGTQLVLWSNLKFAKKDHMAASLAQRREQIVNDCFQLKTDLDVYNDFNPEQEPLQLVLDFTDDVAEREIGLEIAA